VKNLECFSKVCVHTLGDNVMLVVLGVVEVERQGDNTTPSWRDPRRMSNGNKIYLEVMLDPTFFLFLLLVWSCIFILFFPLSFARVPPQVLGDNFCYQAKLSSMGYSLCRFIFLFFIF